MLSVLAYKLRIKSGVVTMLSDMRMDGFDFAVGLPPRQRLGSETPILPHLGFTDE